MRDSTVAERTGSPALRVFGAFPAPEPKPVETIDGKIPALTLRTGAVATIRVWADADAPPDALPLLFAPGFSLTIRLRGR